MNEANLYNILFKNGEPITADEITGCINKFGRGYNDAVRDIINNSNQLTHKTFQENVARILNNFGMSRSGPFKGVKPFNGINITDPAGKIEECWKILKDDLKDIKKALDKQSCKPWERI